MGNCLSGEGHYQVHAGHLHGQDVVSTEERYRRKWGEGYGGGANRGGANGVIGMKATVADVNNGTHHRNVNYGNNLPAIDEYASLRQSSPTRLVQNSTQLQPKQGGGYDPASPMRNAAVGRSAQGGNVDIIGGQLGRLAEQPRVVEREHQQPQMQRRNSNGNSGNYHQHQQGYAQYQNHHQGVPKNWSCGELLGQGAFGSVYLGMDGDSGTLMAVKQVSLGHNGSSSTKLAEHIKSLEAEVNLLRQLDHPNIVRYLGTEKTGKVLNIFLEYVPGGSIASLLANFGSFKEPVVKLYTKQILLGLAYLHRNAIMHRDIKGANILVDNTGTVKLADFGASKKIEELVTVGSGANSVKGTPYWMAPEVITQTGHGRQADIWSVACTVIEMATGKPPWSQYGSQVSAMFHIAKSKGPPLIPHELSPECKDFLYLCFNRNWRERPSAETLLEHPFVADVKCPVASVRSMPMRMDGRAPDAGQEDGVGMSSMQQSRARRQLQMGDNLGDAQGQVRPQQQQQMPPQQPLRPTSTSQQKVTMRASAPAFSAVMAREVRAGGLTGNAAATPVAAPVGSKQTTNVMACAKSTSVSKSSAGSASVSETPAAGPATALITTKNATSNSNTSNSQPSGSISHSTTTNKSNSSSLQFNPVEEPEGIHQQAKHAIDSLRTAIGATSIGAGTTVSLGCGASSASSLAGGASSAGVRTSITSGAASGASGARTTTTTTSHSAGPIVYTVARENSNDSSVPGLPWDVRESWASGGTIGATFGASGHNSGTASGTATSSGGTNSAGATHTTGSTVVNARIQSSLDRSLDRGIGLDRSWSSTSSHDSLTDGQNCRINNNSLNLPRPRSASGLREFSTPRKPTVVPRSAASTPGQTPSRIPRPPNRHSTPLTKITPSKQGLVGRHSMPTPGRQYAERLERKQSGGMAPPPPRSASRKLQV